MPLATVATAGRSVAHNSFVGVVLREVVLAGLKKLAQGELFQPGRCSWEGTAGCWDTPGCTHLAGC